MCGIFALLNNTSTLNPEDVKMAFELGNNRGPEDSEFIKYDNSIDIGFKRLAINGLNKLSRQPMTIDNITLICNGEIYNYKELFKEINVTPTTQSDCEIIIHLYKKYGIRHTLMLLDGYFAFILYDYRTENSEPQFIVARDPFGVRPLFILEQNHIQDENKHNNILYYIFEWPNGAKADKHCSEYTNKYPPGSIVTKLIFDKILRKSIELESLKVAEAYSLARIGEKWHELLSN